MSRLEHPDDDLRHRVIPLYPKDTDGSFSTGEERTAVADEAATIPPMVRSPPTDDADGPSPVLPCVLLGGLAGAGSTGVALGIGVPVWLGLLLWPAVGLAVAFFAILAVLVCSRSHVREMQVTFADGEEKPVGTDWLNGAIARPLGAHRPPGGTPQESESRGNADPCPCDD